jgi:hypothetical protein
MISATLLTEKKQIDDLFAEVKSFSGDFSIESLLAQYLCVKVSGFIQNCVRIIFVEYTISNCQGSVQTFVLGKLEEFPNPTYGKIIEIAQKFNDQWSKDLKIKITDKQKSSLNSINVNRNNIAHGGQSTITLRELSNYYDDVVKLIEELENCCK